MMVTEQGILIVTVLHVEVSISPPETPWALSERDICVHVRASARVCVCVKDFFFPVTPNVTNKYSNPAFSTSYRINFKLLFQTVAMISQNRYIKLSNSSSMLVCRGRLKRQQA